jgi:hypothetical protein
MIHKFVARFMDGKTELRNQFKENEPTQYKDIVKAVITLVRDEDDYEYNPDPDNITIINDGDYQGTLLFVIPESTYQPRNYWYVKVWYGSCSGCDTLYGIQGDRNWDVEVPTEGQLDDYMTLALHIVQNLKKMED